MRGWPAGAAPASRDRAARRRHRPERSAAEPTAGDASRAATGRPRAAHRQLVIDHEGDQQHGDDAGDPDQRRCPGRRGPRLARSSARSRSGCCGGGAGGRGVEGGDGLLRIEPEKARVRPQEAANVDRGADRAPVLVLDGRQVDRANANLLGNVGKREAASLACGAKPLPAQSSGIWGFELAPP